jgi:O-antigen ligase
MAFPKFNMALASFSRSGTLLQTVLLVGPLVTSAIPLFAPIFFAILTSLLIWTGLRRGAQWRDLLPCSPAGAVCLFLAAYVFVNATWSADTATGLRKAALYASLVFMSFAAVKAVPAWDRGTLRFAGLLFAVGTFGGALFILIELLTHGLMTSIIMNWVPLLRPKSSYHLEITQGQVTGMDLDQLSHNVGFAMYSLWPGLLALSSLAGFIRWVAMSSFFVTIAVVVINSVHASSKVALFGSSIVVIAMWRWPRYVIRALTVIWCVSFVLVVPASFIAYQSGLHFATWLPNTARQRVIIWEYTAEQVLSHPLLGVGVESTPVLNAQQRVTGPLEQPEGFVYPRSLGSHAHDIFLQAWFELGAVGAFLLAMAGAAVAMLIPLLQPSAQPFAAGTFAVFALIGAFAWGMWPAWFMCSAALLPIYLRVATANSRTMSTSK